jgi:hypothetical protein
LAFLFGFAFPCLACDGGTAGVAGVAGLDAGGLADRAGTAGVACSWLPESGFCLGAAGGGAADGFGALAAGGADDVLPAVVPPVEVGWPAVGLPGAGPGVGAPGVPGEGVGVGAPGVPPPAGELGAGPRVVAGVGTLELKIGVKPVNTDGETGRVTTCGRAGETSAGTLRTCVPGTASSRVAERSSTLKACSQSWADATAPAATAPT